MPSLLEDEILKAAAPVQVAGDFVDPLEAGTAPLAQPSPTVETGEGFVDPAAVPGAVERRFGSTAPISEPEPVKPARANLGIPEELENEMPVLQRLKDQVSGDKTREFDFPELPQNIKVGDETVALQSETGFARGNPVGAAMIFNETLPDVPVKFDKFGNPYVEFENNLMSAEGSAGKVFYLNRPGASLGDIGEVVAEGLAVASFGRLGGGAGTAAFGGGGRALGVGVGTGVGSVSIDLISNILGSDQPIDVQKAELFAALGFTGEIIIPLAGRFLGAIFGNKQMYRNGKLTPRGEEALKKANIPPEAVTPEFAKVFAAEARASVVPAEAAAVAEARGLPTPVRLSKGDVSRDVNQQSFEDAARAGARGEPAKDVMVPFRQAQQEELQANLPQIQERLGGGQAAVSEVGEGARAGVAAVRSAESQSRAGIRNAYEAARASDGRLPGDAVREFSKDLRGNLRQDGFDVGSMPAVQRRLADVEKINKMPGKVTTVKLNEMEIWRKRIVRDIESAKASNPSEAEALRIMKRDFDEFVEGVADNALLLGDDASVALWQKAIKDRAAHGVKFEANKVVKKLISEDVTAETAAGYILGMGRLGGTTEAATVLKAVKAIVGKDSPAFRAIKEEAFLKLLKTQRSLEGLEPEFSGQLFATELNNLRRNAPTLARELFTKEEMALLLQFRDTALRATTLTRGAGNPSGTARELARLAEGIFGQSGRLTNIIIGRLGRKLAEEGSAQAARAATSQSLEPVKVFAPGLPGALTAPIGTALPPDTVSDPLSDLIDTLTGG